MLIGNEPDPFGHFITQQQPTIHADLTPGQDADLTPVKPTSSHQGDRWSVSKDQMPHKQKQSLSPCLILLPGRETSKS